LITVSRHGTFEKTVGWLKNMMKSTPVRILEYYGEMGVQALKEATPKDTGLTSESWRYEITRNKGGYALTWCNDNIKMGQSIALLIQYGHATFDGGWVEGVDYINPALKPIFEKISRDLGVEVTSGL
jgi:hypothetical protein